MHPLSLLSLRITGLRFRMKTLGLHRLMTQVDQVRTESANFRVYRWDRMSGEKGGACGWTEWSGRARHPRPDENGPAVQSGRLGACRLGNEHGNGEAQGGYEE